jgi:hypothetical protein
LQPLDRIPLLAFFTGVVVLALLAIEGGYKLGKNRRKSSNNEDESPVGSTISSTLALLAFMLAFTFGMAASRFDDRRAAVVEEANAIGTAYLRADLLEDPLKSNVKDTLHKYLLLRINGLSQPSLLGRTISQSEALQTRLWQEATEVGQSYPNSPVAALFIDSINTVIDLHTKRITANFRARVPESIWDVLFLVAALSMAGMGYYFGVTDNRSWTANIVLVLAFSAVMLLVVDLDRPWEGSLKVN